MADGSLPSNIYTRSNGQLHAPGVQKDRLNMTVIDNYGISGQKSNSKTDKLAAAYGGVAMTPSTTQPYQTVGSRSRGEHTLLGS